MGLILRCDILKVFNHLLGALKYLTHNVLAFSMVFFGLLTSPSDASDLLLQKEFVVVSLFSDEILFSFFFADCLHRLLSRNKFSLVRVFFDNFAVINFEFF